MARSFGSGLVWGIVVVGAGLALISQLAPPPKGLPAVPATVAVNPQAPADAATSDATNKDEAKPVEAKPVEAKPNAGTAAQSQPAVTTDQPAAADATKPVATGSDGVNAGSATSAQGTAEADGTKAATPSDLAGTGQTAGVAAADEQAADKTAKQPAVAAVNPAPAIPQKPAVVADAGSTAPLDPAAAASGTGTADGSNAAATTKPLLSTGAMANQITTDANAGSDTPDLPAADLPAPAQPEPKQPASQQPAKAQPSSDPASGKVADAAALDQTAPSAAVPDAGQNLATTTAQGGTSAAESSKADPAQVGASEVQPKTGSVANALAAPATAEAARAEPATAAPVVPAPETPDAPQAAAQGEAPAKLPELPAVAEAAPALSSLDAALTAPEADKTPVVQAPAPDAVGAKDALLVPSQGAGLTEPTRLPQIAATEDPGMLPAPLPNVAAPDAADAAPAAPQKLAPRVLKPESPQLPGVKALDSTLPTVLKPSVPGVQTNALPQIGDAPQGTGAASDAGTPGATESATDRPIVKYARKFEGSGGKPLFVVLLHDVGAAGMSREDLAKLPFPVTFVVDPLATDAKVAAKTYREAGQEVLMLANGIPAGATASDLAQTFQTLQDILPEAVGVIDQATAGFQDNRALATLVLPVIADQGRGIVTYDRGLNAADQIARRDGLPAAVIFRRLDGEGESQPVIRRYLDRAAFKAAQEGSVVVIGDTRADTVATILQWTIEGKASGVDLAPVTAVMGRK